MPSSVQLLFKMRNAITKLVHALSGSFSLGRVVEFESTQNHKIIRKSIYIGFHLDETESCHKMWSLSCITFCALLMVVSSRLSDFYFLPPGESLEILGNCSKCPPGWGVKRPCTANTTTECERCVTGATYSSHYSNFGRCWPCSRCGVGLYEASKCSGRRDTICDDCMRIIYKPEIQNNGDFRKKCGYLYLSKNRLKPGKIAVSFKHKAVP